MRRAETPGVFRIGPVQFPISRLFTTMYLSDLAAIEIPYRLFAGRALNISPAEHSAMVKSLASFQTAMQSRVLGEAVPTAPTCIPCSKPSPFAIEIPH